MARKVQASISKFFRAVPESQKKRSIEEVSLAHAVSNNGGPSKYKVPRKGLQDFTYGNKSAAISNRDRSNDNNDDDDVIELAGNENAAEVMSDSKSSTNAPVPKSTTKAKPKKTSYTPLENQIKEFQDNNIDKLLLFQVGYKYKLFGKDALAGSKILNVMYVPNRDKPEFSYCTFPDFKLHINIKRILTHGHKIGVIKQMESAAIKAVDRQLSLDVMERQLTGIYTSGTYMDDEYIHNGGDISLAGEENRSYIVCILECGDKIGIVAVQPLTGDVIWDYFSDTFARQQLQTRLSVIQVSEIIIISNSGKHSHETLRVLKTIASISEHRDIPAKSEQQIREEIDNFFNTIGDDSNFQHLGNYYLVNFPLPIQQCFGELIRYLGEFNLSSLFTKINNISKFTDAKQYMSLPGNVLSALDIFVNSSNPSSDKGTLIWLLDHTRTRFGSRKLQKWISQPLLDPIAIELRSSAIENLAADFDTLVDAVKNFLEKIGRTYDLDSLLIKAHYSSAYDSGRVSRREVYNMLKCFNDVLDIVNRFRKHIENRPFKSELLTQIFDNLLELSSNDCLEKLLRKINKSFLGIDSKNVNDIKMNFFDLQFASYPQIEHELQQIEECEKLLDEELKSIRRLLGRSTMEYVTNKNDKYLIEVRNGKQVDALPKDWVKISGTTTVSRFHSPQIVKTFKLLQYHQELLYLKCDRAYVDYLKEIDEQYNFFRQIVGQLGDFDCLLSLTAASILGEGYVKPKINHSHQIIKAALSRNPIIEHLKHNAGYVANDVDISYDGNRVLIITGPNMGGKSSYVKQIALLVIMTQIGCYLPCESAEIGIFDSIFVRMGASDNILKGESTFMTEMLECSDIINKMSSKSLIILDEIGRGTGTQDGIALADSILRFLVESEQSPLTLFITHYQNLHSIEDSYKGIVKNCHMGYLEIENSEHGFPEVIFLYTLQEGVVSNLYGLNVAKLAGLPIELIKAAFDYSEELKKYIEEKDYENRAIAMVKLLKTLSGPEYKCDRDSILQLFIE